MHPFHRHGNHFSSQSNGSKDKSRRDGYDRRRNGGYSEDDDEAESSNSFRRTSPSRSKRNQYQSSEDAESYNQSTVPTVRIGQQQEYYNSNKSPKKQSDILKAKEQALWSNTSSECDHNLERLGPNTNNIIEESLKKSD